MTHHYAQYLPLAEQLDHRYAQALDRLEAHVLDAADLNQEVGHILHRDNIEVMPITSDSSTSPREIFNAIAEALAGRVLPELSVTPGKGGYRIHDLLDWSDMPNRGNRTEQEFQLAKIAYARNKTVTGFLEQLVIRFNPTALPDAAIHQALQDLIQVYSVHTAMGVVIPVRREGAPAVVRYPFHRREEEAMWHLVQRHHAGVVRGANAMATVALLNKQHTIAAALADMLNALDVRLSQTMMRYEAGQSFPAATFLKLSLQRDGADFHLGESLFRLLRDALEEHISDVRLVFH